MSFFQSIGGREQDLHGNGLSLDATSSNDGLGELDGRILGNGSLSPKFAASSQPRPTSASDSQVGALDTPAEEPLIPSSLFSTNTTALTQVVRPSISPNVSDKDCSVATVPSAPSEANVDSDPSATLASFLFNTSSTPSFFQPDLTQYGSDFANQFQVPTVASGTEKYRPNSTNVVSVAASTHAGQRDLTIEQLQQYSSL
ncbi:hypothetical protein IWW38_005957 [Coemansia aciculifera]|uniref:Uncharacterized protein n=1 Tax=Coemansia aciculifera TaxID=417176 RepID=A0ACC1LV24_9FUNG|nr:hypothetical protein IWW38_005957 [Coemansia aciculifera]